MTKEFMLNILLADGYTRKEADKAVNTYGFMIYEDIEQAAKDYSMTLEEIRNVEQPGLKAVEYQGKTYIICNPL